jgi:hypothetical protein
MAGEHGIEAVPPRRLRDRPRREVMEIDGEPRERLERVV